MTTNMPVNLETFADAAALADAAATAIAGKLGRQRLYRLVATGGRSAGPIYDRLCGLELAWSRVIVTLSDERFVDPASADSNELLVRERLLRDRASAATFVPLRAGGGTPEDDAREAEPRIRSLLPFDAVMLGMGEDGHVASLFPGMPNLAEALDLDGVRLVVGVAAAGVAPHEPRISLTAKALLDARLIVVMTSGEAKRALLERVMAEPDFAPPVATILRQSRVPVRLMWSP
ncbi:MAG: 6-phosphogluconolactonase [Caulobacterales bacterium]